MLCLYFHFSHWLCSEMNRNISSVSADSYLCCGIYSRIYIFCVSCLSFHFLLLIYGVCWVCCLLYHWYCHCDFVAFAVLLVLHVLHDKNIKFGLILIKKVCFNSSSFVFKMLIWVCTTLNIPKPFSWRFASSSVATSTPL